jgi:hypothetical protein
MGQRNYLRFSTSTFSHIIMENVPIWAPLIKKLSHPPELGFLESKLKINICILYIHRADEKTTRMAATQTFAHTRIHHVYRGGWCDMRTLAFGMANWATLPPHGIQPSNFIVLIITLLAMFIFSLFTHERVSEREIERNEQKFNFSLYCFITFNIIFAKWNKTFVFPK